MINPWLALSFKALSLALTHKTWLRFACCDWLRGAPGCERKRAAWCPKRLRLLLRLR